MAFPIVFGKRPSHTRKNGFTFIELAVVMAILSLLLSIALPRYFDGLKRAKEAVLHEDLATMRTAIDHFHADKGSYPASLDDLVNFRYLRTIPVDPITERADTWVIITPPDYSQRVYDLHSGSAEIASDGTPYNTW
jgi:general secretion pathway protein G